MKIPAALFTILIIVIIVLADMGSLGFLGGLYNFPYGDKAGHFILFGILSFLIVLAVLRSRRHPDPIRATVVVTLVLTLFITVEEISQIFFPNRTFSLLDLSFSLAGTFLGAWLAWKLAQKSR